ncbi:hypothetical protein VP01_687g3, partial [Puccinia sorghi]
MANFLANGNVSSGRKLVLINSAAGPSPTGANGPESNVSAPQRPSIFPFVLFGASQSSRSMVNQQFFLLGDDSHLWGQVFKVECHIGKYNTQFSSLVYLVEDVEADHIKKYIDRLSPRIIQKVMRKEWCSEKNLVNKTELASQVAADINILASFPSVSATV